jgi:hypothetical protein
LIKEIEIERDARRNKEREIDMEITIHKVNVKQRDKRSEGRR